jgi:23S rRNA (guanine2445-N2)-methyltransferase / 23S rRNA (guanine2069-N7)-methyltransferase
MTNNDMKFFFATCPKNLEGLLEEELISLGAKETKQTVAGVKFVGDLALAYRICLWSRLANRILLTLATFSAEDASSLYYGIRKINWLDHLRADSSLVVDFAGISATITNSHFGALKVKDAIIDQIREATDKRPDIDKENPDLRVNIYLYHEVATVSIDLSGDSLHRRGYRSCPGSAPLKENLAAAILYRSKWREFAKLGKPLFDPMCGSGTILIEAAMMAQDYAPGLLRKSFGFSKWLGHDPKMWQKLLDEASERRHKGAEKFSAVICGCDVDPDVIAMAKDHIGNAGLEKVVKVTQGEVKQSSPAKYHIEQLGIIVTNPPYGERLSEVESLTELYSDFGAVLRKNFLGWEVAMITGNPDLGKNMGIRSYKQYNFFNGTIPCKLLLFRIMPDMFWREYKGNK